jgi:hypothetical protein
MRRSRGVDKNLRLRDHNIVEVLRTRRTTFVGFAEVVAHERVAGSGCVIYVRSLIDWLNRRKPQKRVIPPHGIHRSEQRLPVALGSLIAEHTRRVFKPIGGCRVEPVQSRIGETVT